MRHIFIQLLNGSGWVVGGWHQNYHEMSLTTVMSSKENIELYLEHARNSIVIKLVFFVFNKQSSKPVITTVVLCIKFLLFFGMTRSRHWWDVNVYTYAWFRYPNVVLIFDSHTYSIHLRCSRVSNAHTDSRTAIHLVLVTLFRLYARSTNANTMELYQNTNQSSCCLWLNGFQFTNHASTCIFYPFRRTNWNISSFVLISIYMAASDYPPVSSSFCNFANHSAENKKLESKEDASRQYVNLWLSPWLILVSISFRQRAN